MRAGQLTHRLTFQVKQVVIDSFSTPVEVWTDDFTVWGAFEPLNSKEFPANQKRISETTARFRIRRREGIDPRRHRIVFSVNPAASPPVFSVWNIFPPLAVGGKLRELTIEAQEID